MPWRRLLLPGNITQRNSVDKDHILSVLSLSPFMSLSLSPDLTDGEGLLDGSASVVDELAHVEEHLCTVQRLSANAQPLAPLA